MENIKILQIIKGLLHMLTNRIEKLEKRMDELEKEKRNSSIQEFEESKKYYKKELDELDRII